MRANRTQVGRRIQTRPPSAEITNGLTTIADKIRALAHADYDPEKSAR
jgi:hypothetical protein